MIIPHTRYKVPSNRTKTTTAMCPTKRANYIANLWTSTKHHRTTSHEPHRVDRRTGTICLALRIVSEPPLCANTKRQISHARVAPVVRTPPHQLRHRRRIIAARIRPATRQTAARFANHAPISTTLPKKSASKSSANATNASPSIKQSHRHLPLILPPSSSWPSKSNTNRSVRSWIFLCRRNDERSRTVC